MTSRRPRRRRRAPYGAAEGFVFALWVAGFLGVLVILGI